MKRLSDFLFTVAVFAAIFVVVALMFCTFAALAYPKYFPNPEPTESISWSVIEEVGRDGNDVHYRIHSSNGLTVDRYTREEE